VFIAGVGGSTLTPTGHALGVAMPGSQGDVICGDPTPAVCDDGPYGKGTGGQLSYDIALGRSPRTVWFAVAGSDLGAAPAQAELTRALIDPAPHGEPLASIAHATLGLTQRERDCFTGEFGFYHTGTGPTSATGGSNKGPSPRGRRSPR
jgi:hypothetical protein